MGRFKLESYHGRPLESGPKGYEGLTGAKEEKKSNREDRMHTDEERIASALACIPEDTDDDLFELKEDDNEKIEEQDFGTFAKNVADYPYDRPTAKDVINAENEITGKDEYDR